MTATKTELHRKTAEVLKPVEAGQTVVLTENGKPFAKIVPTRPIDWNKATDALKKIGAVPMPAR